MSKQYMTIQFGDRTATVRTNSEKAIKNALGKLRNNVGHVVSIEVKGNEIKFQIAYRKASKGEFQATYDRYATIIENTFVTEETAEVVEVATEETAEVITAYTMDTDDTTYAVDAAEVAAWLAEETAEVVEAPATEVVEVSTEEHTVTMSVEEKRAAWDIFVKEWAKGHAEDIHAIRAAEAKTVNA